MPTSVKARFLILKYQCEFYIYILYIYTIYVHIIIFIVELRAELVFWICKRN